MHHMTKHSPAKTGEYPRIFPNFQNRACCKKYLKDNKHKSLHLARKYARIFVLGHYLFLEVHNFPRATLSENCSPLGTDNVCGQISEHINFTPSGGYCLYAFCECSVSIFVTTSFIIFSVSMLSSLKLCEVSERFKLCKSNGSS